MSRRLSSRGIRLELFSMVCALTVIMVAGSMTCRASAQQSVQSASQSTSPGFEGLARGKKAFNADERVSIILPNEPVELAQPVQVKVILTEPDVVAFTVRQYDEHSDFQNESAGEDVGTTIAKIVRDEGLTKIVEIVPLQTGVVKVDFDIMFADAGISHKSYQLSVVPSSKGLKTFYLDQGFHALPLVLEDKEEDRQELLSPEVYYSQLNYPIFLRNSEQIELTLLQPEGAPVIRVDSNGLVHALRAGTATITGHFAGAENSVVVHVYTKEDAPAGYRHIVPAKP